METGGIKVASNPYQAYEQNNVMTASPGELTLMLYNGCLKFIRLGKKGIEMNNLEMKNKNLVNAQAIISEFIATMDRSIPITHQFLPLYDFINRLLIQANIKNDIKALEDAESLVVEFRDTWKEVLKKTRVQQHAASGGRV